MGAGSSVQDVQQLPSIGDVDSWPTSIVVEALNAWGLEHLQHNFTKQNINGRLFLRLDEEAFKELGCTALEASRLVMYMDQVKNANNQVMMMSYNNNNSNNNNSPNYSSRRGRNSPTTTKNNNSRNRSSYGRSNSPTQRQYFNNHNMMEQQQQQQMEQQPILPARWDSATMANKQLIEKSIKSSGELWLDGEYDKTYDMLDDVATLLISRPLDQPALIRLNLEAFVSRAQKRATARAERSAKNAAVILRKCLQSYLEQLCDAIEGVTDFSDQIMLRKKNESQ